MFVLRDVIYLICENILLFLKDIKVLVLKEYYCIGVFIVLFVFITLVLFLNGIINVGTHIGNFFVLKNNY